MIPEIKALLAEIYEEPTQVTRLADLCEIIEKMTPHEQYVAWHIMLGYTLEETRKLTNSSMAQVVKVRKSLREWEP